MSFFASVLRAAYKFSGAKKAFTLPEDEILKVIEKQNRSRGVFTPKDHKAHYEMITVNGFPCLIVRERPQPSKRAILYFFGGGMVIGPDRGDLPVMRKLAFDSGCDVWFPFYPLCTEHCITDTYAMAYECYRKMIGIYGGGNVSTCGFSSGGERQRIAIARAMLKDAPVVVLDEATAYIDPENEAVIQRAVAKLVADKTVIVIAHRLSTITGAAKSGGHVFLLISRGYIPMFCLCGPYEAYRPQHICRECGSRSRRTRRAYPARRHW